MKQISCLISTALLLFSLELKAARLDWWIAHSEKLSKQWDKAVNDPMVDKKLIALLEIDISCANEAIIFYRNNNDKNRPNALKAEDAVNTANSITAEVIIDYIQEMLSKKNPHDEIRESILKSIRKKKDIEHIKSYKDKYILLIKTASLVKKLSTTDQIQKLKNHKEQCKKYTAEIIKLYSEAVNDISAPDHQFQKKCAVLSKKTRSILHTLMEAGTQTQDDKSTFTKSQIAEIKEIKSEMSRIERDAGDSITRSYITAINIRKNKKIERASDDISLEKKLAAYDLDLLKASLERYQSLAAENDYAQKAFADYAARYHNIESESRRSITEEIEKVSKTRSIMPLVENFNPEKIKHEYKTKIALSDILLTRLTQISSAIKYYSSKKISVKGYGTSTVADHRIKNLFKSVSIEGHIMNERNFCEIDRNLAKILEDRYNRLIWKTGPEQNKNAHINLQEPMLSFTLPRGFKERKPNDSEIYYGVQKAMVSNDNNATIRLISSPADNSDIKEALEQWILRCGGSPVEKGWSKKGSTDYFRMISRDNERNIVESYAFVRDGYNIFISGTISPHFHNAFKAKLSLIIDSIGM